MFTCIFMTRQKMTDSKVKNDTDETLLSPITVIDLKNPQLKFRPTTRIDSLEISTTSSIIATKYLKAGIQRN